jgi:hypothetical protein
MDKITKKDTELKSVARPTEGGEDQVRVNWDSSKMKSSYANVCNVSSTREEVVLMFGTNQSWNAGQKELTVELSDRIVLNPYAAKRLSLVLGNVISAYEGRFGVLPLEETPK